LRGAGRVRRAVTGRVVGRNLDELGEEALLLAAMRGEKVVDGLGDAGH